MNYRLTCSTFLTLTLTLFASAFAFAQGSKSPGRGTTTGGTTFPSTSGTAPTQPTLNIPDSTVGRRKPCRARRLWAEPSAGTTWRCPATCGQGNTGPSPAPQQAVPGTRPAARPPSVPPSAPDVSAGGVAVGLTVLATCVTWALGNASRGRPPSATPAVTALSGDGGGWFRPR